MASLNSLAGGQVTFYNMTSVAISSVSVNGTNVCNALGAFQPAAAVPSFTFSITRMPFTLQVNYSNGQNAVGTMTCNLPPNNLVVWSYLNGFVLGSPTGLAGQITFSNSLSEVLGQVHGAVVPVIMFNANIVGVQVSVNNGAPFSINPTSSTLLFTPQRPAVNPTFNYQTPAPNVLAPGNNVLNITPVGSPNPLPFNLHIPTVTQIISLQIYIYWNIDQSVAWAVLNNGQLLSASWIPG